MTSATFRLGFGFIATALVSGAISAPAVAQSGAPQNRDAVCQGYAQTAVAQQKQNIERGCGYAGGEWNTDPKPHYDWCMRDGPVDWGTKLRAEALNKCNPSKVEPPKDLANASCPDLVKFHQDLLGRAAAFRTNSERVAQALATADAVERRLRPALANQNILGNLPSVQSSGSILDDVKATAMNVGVRAASLLNSAAVKSHAAALASVRKARKELKDVERRRVDVAESINQVRTRAEATQCVMTYFPPPPAPPPPAPPPSSVSASAAAPDGPITTTMTVSDSGEITIESRPGTPPVKASGTQEVKAGDILITQGDAGVLLDEWGRLWYVTGGSRSHSRASVGTDTGDDSSERRRRDRVDEARVREDAGLGPLTIDIDEGDLLVADDESAPSPSTLSVKTPGATVKPKGTIFSVGYDGRTGVTAVAVLEGSVEVVPNGPAARAATLYAGDVVTVVGGVVTVRDRLPFVLSATRGATATANPVGSGPTAASPSSAMATPLKNGGVSDAVSTPPSTASGTGGSCTTFAGTWTSNFGGDLVITVDGANARGVWSRAGQQNTFIGRLQGGALDLTWDNQASQHWVLVKGGREFNGDGWFATCASPPQGAPVIKNGGVSDAQYVPPTVLSSCQGFAGTWNTNYGELTVKVSGTQVTGGLPRYNGSINGTLSGGVITGVRRAPGYADASYRLVLADGGRRIEGAVEVSPNNFVPWTGTCAGP